jgi:hypothetical protein
MRARSSGGTKPKFRKAANGLVPQLYEAYSSSPARRGRGSPHEVLSTKAHGRPLSSTRPAGLAASARWFSCAAHAGEACDREGGLHASRFPWLFDSVICVLRAAYQVDEWGEAQLLLTRRATAKRARHHLLACNTPGSLSF